MDWVWIWELVKSLIAGIILWASFTLLKLPLPAPPVLWGIVGIIWVYIWFIIIWKYL